VLVSLQIEQAAPWTKDVDASYACLFALAASHWNIDSTQAASAYLWAWCENQVLAAVKFCWGRPQVSIHDLLQHSRYGQCRCAFKR
jgi:urease accessory protein UreF